MTPEGTLLLVVAVVFLGQVVVSRAMFFDSIGYAIMFSAYFAVSVLALTVLLSLILS